MRETGPLSLHDRQRALQAMMASAGLFGLMAGLTKMVTRSTPILPAGEIAFVRYVCGIVFLLALTRGNVPRLFGRDRRGLLARGILGGLSSTIYFLGIQHTSLTNATLLNYTFVVWGPLMAVLSLGERLGRRGSLALIVALCGVGIVTHPDLHHVRSGDALALCSGLMAGAAVVQVRRLRRTETSISIFFYFNLLGLPVSLLALLLTRSALVPPTPMQGLLLAGVGATSVGGQFLMTYSYRALTTAQGSLLTLLTVLYAAVFARLVFFDPITPPTILGGLLIVFSAASITRLDARRQKRALNPGSDEIS